MIKAGRRMGETLLPLVLLTAFCAGFHSIIEEDLWWHLRAGEEIIAGHGIPRIDQYSYPSAGRPYLDLHWLFQVFVDLVYRAAGLGGVIWAKCLIVMATFWIVYRLARRGAPGLLAATIAGIGVVLASERFIARPEIITFLLLALTLWLLRRHEEGSTRAWALLPVVLLVWANTEGLFILGLGVIAAHLPCRVRDRRLWMSFGLSIAATLVNPYFAIGALHPLVLFTRINGAMAIYSRTIGEFLGPFTPGIPHPSVALFPFFLGLVAVALLLYARRPPLHEIILMAAVIYLGLRARRNLAPLAIVSVPIVTRWIGQGRGAALFRSFRKRMPARRVEVASALLVGIVCLGFLGYDLCLANGMIYRAIGTNRRFGVGIAEGGAPVGGVAFLRENRVRGPIFNTLGAGGYLIYAYPEEKVFIDGRLEVHATEHYASYLSLLSGGEPWRKADERYGFRCLLLSYAEAPGLTRERLGDIAWAPVYLDGSAIVLLKEDAGNRGLIDRYRLTRETLAQRFAAFTDADLASLPVVRRDTFLRRLFRFGEPVPWTEFYLGQFFAMIQMPELEAGEYARAVRRAPHELTPRLALSGALARMGRADDALRVLATARPLARSGADRERIDRQLKEIDSARAPQGGPPDRS